MLRILGQGVEPRTRVIVAGKDVMLAGAGSHSCAAIRIGREIEHLIAEQGLVKRQLPRWIGDQQGTPDEAPGRGEKIGRIARVARQHREGRAVRIRQDCLPTPMRVAVRGGNDFAAVRDRRLHRGIDVFHGDEAKPPRLLPFAGGNGLFVNPRERLAIEQRHRVMPVARHGLECPAEQGAIEALGGDRIGGHEIGPDDLANMVFAARFSSHRRQNDGRGMRLRAEDGCHRGEQQRRKVESD